MGEGKDGTEGRSHDGFIPPHGGYKNLLSYNKAEIVYDATVRFCDRFLDKRDRTVDQMIQAARSGKQNIIEGSQVSGTSKEMEIKLVNVARASLEELLADYHDFIRVHGLDLWDKDSPYAKAVRKMAYKTSPPVAESRNLDGCPSQDRSHESYETYRTYIENRSAGTVANIIICLIHQANYLLDRQLRQLEQAFLEQGGLRERMTQARLQVRARPNRNYRP